jgi:hypothetical protein
MNAPSLDLTTPTLPDWIARLTDSAPVRVIPVALLQTLQTGVCAWCTPKPELDRLNRAHPGQISHGICKRCEAAFEREIAKKDGAR